jgi:hypothetical protein
VLGARQVATGRGEVRHGQQQKQAGEFAKSHSGRKLCNNRSSRERIRQGVSLSVRSTEQPCRHLTARAA